MMMFLAILLKLTMSQPVFCIQEQVGQDGSLIRLLKFCSSHTWLGALLDRFSVDKLPGLISVLMGEVSLIELWQKQQLR
jgi:lipopolysaccharide/colanic/teichoic acid biosynthesis glycosyltransferase